MTEETKELPSEQIHIEEPQPSEPELTKEEIDKQIKFWWKEVETIDGWDKYVAAWKELDHYRDLKQKLYK